MCSESGIGWNDVYGRSPKVRGMHLGLESRDYWQSQGGTYSEMRRDRYISRTLCQTGGEEVWRLARKNSNGRPRSCNSVPSDVVPVALLTVSRDPGEELAQLTQSQAAPRQDAEA